MRTLLFSLTVVSLAFEQLCVAGMYGQMYRDRD
jgi:hypothetical protein